MADECAALPGLTEAQRAQALREAGELRVLVGDYPGAEREFKRALTLSPEDAATLRDLAELTRSRPEEALAYAEKAGAHGLAGEIRLDLGDAAGAEASFTRALSISGDDLEALRAMLRLKHAPSYALAAERAAERAPLWLRAAAYRFTAALWLESKEPSKAVSSLRKALVLEPDSLDDLAILVQIKREGPAQPLPADERAAEGPAPEPAPDSLEGMRKRIEIERSRSNLPEARALADRFTLAVAKAPAWQRIEASCLIARLWLSLGDAAKAWAIADRVQRQDPRSFDIRRLVVEINPSPRDLPYFKKNVTFAYLEGVRARRELGDSAGAEAALQRALALDPRDPQTLEDMVDFLLAAGRTGDARRFAKRLTEAARQESLVDIFERAPKDFPVLASELAGAGEEAQVRLAFSDPAIVARLERARERDRSQAHEMMVRVIQGEGGIAEESVAPDDAPSLQALLESKLSQRRPAQALPLAERLIAALASAPAAQRSLAYRLKARAQRELTDEAGAEESLSRALVAAPDDAAALEEMIRAKVDSSRPAQALPYVERLLSSLASAPAAERAAAQRLKGRILRALKDEAGAERSWAKALALLPDDPQALEDMVEAALSRGRPGEARPFAERLLRACERESLGEIAARTPMGPAAGASGIRGGNEQDQALLLLNNPETVAWLEGERGRDRARALRLMVRVLRAEGRPGEALPYAERLIAALASASPAERAAAQQDFRAAIEQDPKGDCFGEFISTHKELLTPPLAELCRERFKGGNEGLRPHP